jgi:GPN-loop GTPase
MTHLETPAINLLSKVDMLSEYYEDLRFGLEFYTDARELARLVNGEEFRFNEKLKRITQRMAEVVEDFGLVSFGLVSVNDKELMMECVREIERALGTHWQQTEELRDFSVSERVQAIEERYSLPNN